MSKGKTFKDTWGDSVIVEPWDYFCSKHATKETKAINLWLMGAAGMNQLILTPAVAKKLGNYLVKLAERKPKNVKR
jgi:hypothetical protein